MRTNIVWQISAVSESGCGFVLADDQSVKTSLGFCCSLLAHYTEDMNPLFNVSKPERTKPSRNDKKKRLTNKKWEGIEEGTTGHFYGNASRTVTDFPLWTFHLSWMFRLRQTFPQLPGLRQPQSPLQIFIRGSQPRLHVSPDTKHTKQHKLQQAL